MALGFLANLGSGIAKLGTGFARGVVGAGKGIGRGVRRLDELDYDEGDEYGTPPFIPRSENAAINPAGDRGVRVLEDAVAVAENSARDDSLLERRNLPINLPMLSMPKPPAEPLPGKASTLPDARATAPIMASAATPPIVPLKAPPSQMSRADLPIPQLPGRSGAPIPYNPIDAAKYDYMIGKARRDPEGNLIPMSQGGGYDRSFKQVLKNALYGASKGVQQTGDLGGAIGGALAAGGGTAINPEAGYEFAFDVGERPKLEAQLKRSRDERAAAMQDILNRAKLEGMDAETGEKRARTDKTRADIDIGNRAENRQQDVARSTIALNEARTKAAQTGNPQKVDRVNPKTNQIETVMVYPNGDERVIGLSGEAEMAKRRDEESFKREKYQQGAETGRTNIREAGENARQQKRLDAQKEATEAASASPLRKSGKTDTKATMGKLREFYKSKGITDDSEIRRRAKKNDITVVD
jgi:hypothetical protein